jgi:hypothetical protein
MNLAFLAFNLALKFHVETMKLIKLALGEIEMIPLCAGLGIFLRGR